MTNCIIKENVKYLTDVKSSCSHTNISGNSYLKADNYFKNMTIIANPGLLNLKENIQVGFTHLPNTYTTTALFYSILE